MDVFKLKLEDTASESMQGMPSTGDVSEDQQQRREAMLRRLAEREGVRAQAQADAKARRVGHDPNSGPGAFDSRFKALASEARSVLEQARTFQEGSTQRSDARQKAGALAADLDGLCVRHAHELLTRDLELAQSQAAEIRREADNLGRVGSAGASGKKFGFQRKASPASVKGIPDAAEGPARAPAAPPASSGDVSGREAAAPTSKGSTVRQDSVAGNEGGAGTAAEVSQPLNEASGHSSENGIGKREGDSQRTKASCPWNGLEATDSSQITSGPQPLGPPQATGNSGRMVVEAKVGETCVLTPSSEQPPPELLLLSLTDCSVTVRGVSASVHCRGLLNCHVALGPVLGAVHLTGLSHCSVTVCCHQLRLHECTDLKLFTRVGNRAIMEDCKGVTVGPYSMVYPGLDGDLERAKMGEENGLWRKPQDFSWLRQTPSPNWDLVE